MSGKGNQNIKLKINLNKISSRFDIRKATAQQREINFDDDIKIIVKSENKKKTFSAISSNHKESKETYKIQKFQIDCRNFMNQQTWKEKILDYIKEAIYPVNQKGTLKEYLIQSKETNKTRVPLPKQELQQNSSHLKFNLKIKMKFNLQAQNKNNQEIASLKFNYMMGHTDQFKELIQEYIEKLWEFFFESAKADYQAASKFYTQILILNNLNEQQGEYQREVRKQMKHFEQVIFFLREMLNL